MDVFSTAVEATTALSACPFVYGIILLSLQDLYCSSSASGGSGSCSSVEEHLHCTLNRLFPVDVDRSLFTIIVHHSECITEEERLLLHSLGVEMLLPQPYTLSALKVSCLLLLLCKRCVCSTICIYKPFRVVYYIVIVLINKLYCGYCYLQKVVRSHALKRSIATT